MDSNTETQHDHWVRYSYQTCVSSFFLAGTRYPFYWIKIHSVARTNQIFSGKASPSPRFSCVTDLALYLSSKTLKPLDCICRGRLPSLRVIPFPFATLCEFATTSSRHSFISLVETVFGVLLPHSPAHRATRPCRATELNISLYQLHDCGSLTSPLESAHIQ